MSYSPWGCKESDMAERLNMHTHSYAIIERASAVDPHVFRPRKKKSVVVQRLFGRLLARCTCACLLIEQGHIFGPHQFGSF